MTGDEMIAAERRRQIEAEGWTPEHDDAHDRQEMAHAARCYTVEAIRRLNYPGRHRHPLMEWPWEQEWWKPSDDPIRNLVKAGALIAAEIDRLQRAAQQEGEQQGYPTTGRQHD